MFEEFLEENRKKIIIILSIVIVLGVALIGFDTFTNYYENKNLQAMKTLQQQNDALRSELSQISSKQIAGDSIEDGNNQEKININTASAQQLDTLPGIGPARAGDIISYRQTHGGFKSIEEIKNIKGIGDKSFESLKGLITVQN